MRETLFRGKRLDNGQCVYGGYTVWGTGHHVIYTLDKYGESNAYEVDPATVEKITFLEGRT